MTKRISSSNRPPDIGTLFLAIQRLDAVLAVIEECASDNEAGRAFLLAQIGQVITTDLLKQFAGEVCHD